jgi:hypothetical protein
MFRKHRMMIKRRESFRPFAPSVLEEAVTDWFEEDDDVPFMMQVFQIREDKRPLIPAVTYVDGSGRLQTVYRRTKYLSHFLLARDPPKFDRSAFGEIWRRTRVVGASPDGQSALNLAAARLRYVAGTAWSTKRYLNIELLKDQQIRGAITA